MPVLERGEQSIDRPCQQIPLERHPDNIMEEHVCVNALVGRVGKPKRK